MARIEDPDDYESRQREFETAGDDFLDQERWYEEHHQAPEAYSDHVREARGVSRGGLAYNVFTLNGAADCADCGVKISGRQRVIGRKDASAWRILHYNERDCQPPARSPTPQAPAASIADRVAPPVMTPTVGLSAGPLGRPCANCGVTVGALVPLRFDHDVQAFVHKSCQAARKGDQESQGV